MEGPRGFEAEYFAPLAALEPGHFWFRARNALIVWALKRHFPSFESFMEVGCGNSFVLSGVAEAFPAAQLCGTEMFPEGLRFAAARMKSARFLQMDARHIPFIDEFDVLGAFDVLEHIQEDEIVLENLRRAVKPSGGLLITVPQHPGLWSAADDYARHVRRYTAHELHAKVERAGFTIVRSTSFVSLLLPGMLFSRRGRENGRQFDPLDEFRISRAMNRSLETVLALERMMIKMGVSFPIGGSRLVLARRSV